MLRAARVEIRKAVSREEREVRRAVDRLADSLVPDLRRGFTEIVNDNKAAQILALVATHGIDGAVRRFDIEAFDEQTKRLVEEARRLGYEKMGRKVLRELGGDLALYGKVGERAERFLRERAARHVVQVLDSTKEGIRESIVSAFQRGLRPEEAAKEIRSMIGLDARRARAVAQYRAGLSARGVQPGRAVELTSKLIDRKLRERAEIIARNEVHTAVSAGRQAAWDTMVEEGALDLDEMIRTWLTAEDERVCPICAPMNGQERRLDEPFETGDGREVMEPGSSVHIMCRCVVTADVAPQAKRRSAA